MMMGVSACLAGERVRYDGKLRPCAWLREQAANVEWCLVCPEVELGLGVPREPIELYRDGDGIALRTVHSAQELGEAMRAWCEQKLEALEGLGLCGFVLRARSPSCGVGNVPIYRDDSNLEYGDGLFAAALRRRWPSLPLILDEELSDPQRAEAFLRAARAYAMAAQR
ncbi:MAG: DUF523 domain-containing protein [Myxococcota bacterium]|jgi:uncharacterized protein YbbK (DUF523 family)|nr:DUF523 domain-containing protein [Myxococcota bacterium]